MDNDDAEDLMDDFDEIEAYEAEEFSTPIDSKCSLVYLKSCLSNLNQGNQLYYVNLINSLPPIKQSSLQQVLSRIDQ